MSGWEWRRQECTVSSLDECKRIYGLGIDCMYRVLSMETEAYKQTESEYKE
jgi:hypothetical protein